MSPTSLTVFHELAVAALRPSSPAPSLPATQMFLAFNATAHSLVANNLSRRAEERAAEVLARLAQLAVALSIPVAAALFVGRGLLPDLFTGEGVCEGACEQQEKEAAVVAARPSRRPPAACTN